MAFDKQNTVTSCPHAKGTNGVVVMTTDVISQLAGAVWDKDEWLGFLIGKRSDGGLLVEIDDISIPYLQERDISDCSYKNCEIPKNAVACIHSHSNMTAFFSRTDYEKFNIRFGLSIVVAQPTTKGGDESAWLGFDYYAEGKFRLPCGSLGVCEFYLKPDVDDWPLEVIVNRGLKTDVKHVGDCDRLSAVSGDRYRTLYKAACGLEEKEPRILRDVFGSSDAILKLLPPPIPPKPKALPKTYKTVGAGSYSPAEFVVDGYYEGWKLPDDEYDDGDWHGYGLPARKW